jgi:hypothetical protein
LEAVYSFLESAAFATLQRMYPTMIHVYITSLKPIMPASP